VRDLGPAIHQAVEGTAYHAYGLPAMMDGASVAKANGLTGRELEIVQGVADGRSNREIAQALWIAEQTVKFHLTNTYRKLGVENRTGLARWAYERSLHSSAKEAGRH
jgi:DNA-binding NarL/FixJ family response regulator